MIFGATALSAALPEMSSEPSSTIVSHKSVFAVGGTEASLHSLTADVYFPQGTLLIHSGCCGSVHRREALVAIVDEREKALLFQPKRRSLTF